MDGGRKRNRELVGREKKMGRSLGVRVKVEQGSKWMMEKRLSLLSFYQSAVPVVPKRTLRRGGVSSSVCAHQINKKEHESCMRGNRFGDG